MARLTAAKRRNLPKSDFGLPGSRGYPMQDRGHAIAAKGRARQAVKAGRMPRSTEEKIDAKADRKLHDGKRREEHRKRDDRRDEKMLKKTRMPR